MLKMMSRNSTITDLVPLAFVSRDRSLPTIIVNAALFVVGFIGNITVFVTLFRNRKSQSRCNRFILHLSFADLAVITIVPPTEIAWHSSIKWDYGNFACKLYKFAYIFGQNATSFILIMISIDRFIAIVYPLVLPSASKRNSRIMLATAWILSFLASIPQSVIFHVAKHPEYQWFTQCVTFNFFPTRGHELAYNLFNLITLYALPLVIITASYSLILWEISKRTRQSREETQGMTSRGRYQLRRSGLGSIERARSRTLKMTIVIVSVFIVCWTPYFVISTWWWFDSYSASQLDPKIQRGLFLFAVSNSCMDPLVYGMFSINFKRELVRCCCCMKSAWRREKLQRVMGTSASSTRKDQHVVNAADKLTLKSSLLNKTPSNRMSPALESSVVESRRTGIPTPSSSSSQSTHSIDRANVNNFMKIKIRDMSDIIPS